MKHIQTDGLVEYFTRNKHQPKAVEFAIEMEKLINDLPQDVDTYTSVWSIHAAHKSDILQKNRSFEVIIELDQEDALISLSLTRGHLSLRKIWRGSIEESTPVIKNFTVEMLEHRANQGTSLSLSIDNKID